MILATSTFGGLLIGVSVVLYIVLLITLGVTSIPAWPLDHVHHRAGVSAPLADRRTDAAHVRRPGRGPIAMGRVVGFVVLTILVCVVLGVVTHRVLIPMLAGGAIVLLGIFVAVRRAGSAGPEA